MAFTRRTCLAWGAAALAPLALSACLGASGPEATVRGFYDAVNAGDVDKAMTFLALEQVSANEMILVKGKVQMAVGVSKQKIDANGGLDSVKVLEESPQGDNQLGVKVQVQFKNGKSETEQMHLLKEQDVWKIKL